MEDLIKALQILLKYGNLKYPTHCGHDSLYVCGINVEDISDEDEKELERLGFHWWGHETEAFMSFRFGSN